MDGTTRAAHAPAALFVSRRLMVEPQWIDYNGHLNMAYYNVLFDYGVNEALATLGLGAEKAAIHGSSFFTAEAHVCYVREVNAHDEVLVSFHLLDHDEKRLHAFLEMRHADEGWLSATSEQMFLNVDTGARRVSPWPDEVAAALARMQAVHDALPRAPQVGSVIGIRRR